MKKLLLFITALITFNSAFSQIKPIQTLRGNYLIDSSLMFKLRDTSFKPTYPALIYRQTDSSLYYYNQTKWGKLGEENLSSYINDPGFLTDDSLDAHAVDVKAPLVLDSVNNTIILDTSRTYGAAATKYYTDSLFANSVNLGNSDLKTPAARVFDVNGNSLTISDSTNGYASSLINANKYQVALNIGHSSGSGSASFGINNLDFTGGFSPSVSQSASFLSDWGLGYSMDSTGWNWNKTETSTVSKMKLDTAGNLSLSHYANNAAGDSVLTTDDNGKVSQKMIYNQPGTIMRFKVDQLDESSLPYTVTADDSYLIVTSVSATTANNVITIPASPTINGRMVVIKNASDGDVTMSTTIFKYNGAPTTAIVLAPGDVLRVIANNGTWWQL